MTVDGMIDDDSLFSRTLWTSHPVIYPPKLHEPTVYYLVRFFESTQMLRAKYFIHAQWPNNCRRVKSFSTLNSENVISCWWVPFAVFAHRFPLNSQTKRCNRGFPCLNSIAVISLLLGNKISGLPGMEKNISLAHWFSSTDFSAAWTSPWIRELKLYCIKIMHNSST